LSLATYITLDLLQLAYLDVFWTTPGLACFNAL
jgi:hypothetical protein